MIQVTNDKGRKFNVKVLFKGDTYGLNKCLTHEKEDPLVEFYDATYAGAEDFDPEGQFVSRYFVDTILGEDKWGSGIGGLNLDGGVPVWSFDEKAMDIVREYLWLQKRLFEIIKDWR